MSENQKIKPRKTIKISKELGKQSFQKFLTSKKKTLRILRKCAQFCKNPTEMAILFSCNPNIISVSSNLIKRNEWRKLDIHLPCFNIQTFSDVRFLIMEDYNDGYFREMGTLENFTLSHAKLGSHPLAIKIFSAIMKLNTKIRKITLNNTDLGSASVEIFRKITNLIDKQNYLEELNMNNNDLGMGSPENLKPFFNYLSFTNIVSILYIADNKFGYAHIENVNNLAKAIQKNKSIKKLALSEEEWSDKNKKIIENALKNSTSISEYSISFIHRSAYKFITVSHN